MATPIATTTAATTTHPLPLLTASRLKSARACQRQHKYRYLDGYVPVEDARPLRFGTLIHEALAAWWGAPAGERLDAATAALDDAQAREAGSDLFDLAAAHALIIGYDARWAGQEFETLAVEQEFRTALVNPTTGHPSRTWELGGKIDALARRPDGSSVIVEHKTTVSDITPGSECWRRLRLDGQISLYFQGARSLGHDVQACVYDIIRKPTQRPFKATPPEARKYTKDGYMYKTQRDTDETPNQFFERLVEAIAEDPSAYYQRGDVVRLDAEMDDALFDVWQLGQQIRESVNVGRFPRNPDSCSLYGRTCAYFAACCGEASLDDPTLFRRVDDPHVELTTATATKGA